MQTRSVPDVQLCTSAELDELLTGYYEVEVQDMREQDNADINEEINGSIDFADSAFDLDFSNYVD